MKTSIFIHIGTHKTGTSIIQKVLIEKSNHLQNEGVKYINLYNFEGAQRLMSTEHYDEVLVKQLKTYLIHIFVVHLQSILYVVSISQEILRHYMLIHLL